MKKHFYILFLAVVLSISALSGCSSQNTGNTAESAVSTALSASQMKSWTFDEEDYYTETKADTVITFNGTDADINGNGAELKDGNLVISSSGIYELTGSFSGSIIVSAENSSEVQILLNNADITSADGPALYVEQSGKTTVSTVADSVNNLTDSSVYTLADGEDEPDSALFSKDDLVLNGLGTLIITANYNDGVKGKDNLIITGGTINVNAVDDGITGRDIFAVTDSVISVDCGGDAFKTTNSEEDEKGELYIEGGTINLIADGDGVDSANAIYLNSGDVTINTGDGAESATKKYTGEFKRNDNFDMDTAVDETEETLTSQKGIKAENIVAISGGTLVTDTVDDSIHSNDAAYISGGSFTISSGDDGIHADNALDISGGEINILTSYEGLEGFTVTISGGDISLYSEDDGINAAGGTDEASADKNEGGAMGYSSGCEITITGGNIYVNADGDGIDANDSIEMTGGTLIVNGPTNNGNGTLDFGGSMLFNGGTIVGSGSSGMLQAPDNSSEAYSIVMLFSSTQTAGQGVVLTSSDGKIIAAAAPNKEYTAITIGSELIENGKEYKLVYGAELTGESDNGVYSSCEIASSIGEVALTVSDMVTYVNESGITDKTTVSGKMQGGNKNWSGTTSDEEAPSGEVPSGEAPNGEAPNGEAPNGEAPNGERPNGERPNGERPSGGAPTDTTSAS